MAYIPDPPTVSSTIELETARNNLQLAIQHLHELREEVAGLTIREIEGSPALSDVWAHLKRIDLEQLCDDEIPF